MEFLFGNRRYVVIGTCIQGEINDVYICREVFEHRQCYLWVVKDHSLARKLTGDFENEKKPDCLEVFSAAGEYCVVLPWNVGRRLTDFILAEGNSMEKVREICTKVIFLCMTAEFPEAILYLLIKQNCVNLGKDGNPYFTYQLNLAKYEQKTEKECVSECAEYLQELLEKTGCVDWSGYELLIKKNKRDGYHSFAELYQDISRGERLKRTSGLRWKWNCFWEKHRPAALRFLKAVCILVGIAALLVLLGDLIFGENLFHKLFFNPFKIIGTESLLQ